MGQYSKQLKNKLDGIINEMAERPSLFARNPDKDFTRSRKIDFQNLIRILLSCGGNSLNKELYGYYKQKNMTVTASAFVQQREKLLPEGIEYLFHEFNSACKDEKEYDGYRLLAVDGSTMTYNGTPAEDTFMPKHGTNGVNQFHVNALFDLLNKVYVDAVVQAKPNANEPKAAWQMMERSAQFCKCIMIGDRGYGGVNLIEHINRIPGAEYLIRIKNNLWKEIQDLPLTDLDIEITINLRTTQTNADKEAYAKGEAKWIAGITDKPYKVGKNKKPKTWDFETPYQLKVRIVRFKISENTWETIATSLPKDAFPPAVLKYLYHLRWGIETNFRELKYAIGVTNFHAKNRDSVLQEIFARLVMYNFCERITMHVVIEQDTDRQWLYQANYTMGIHICRDFYRHLGDEPPDAEDLITHYILPIRPNRADRRKVVPKQAVFFTYRIA